MRGSPRRRSPAQLCLCHHSCAGHGLLYRCWGGGGGCCRTTGASGRPPETNLGLETHGTPPPPLHPSHPPFPGSRTRALLPTTNQAPEAEDRGQARSFTDYRASPLSCSLLWGWAVPWQRPMCPFVVHTKLAMSQVQAEWHWEPGQWRQVTWRSGPFVSSSSPGPCRPARARP